MPSDRSILRLLGLALKREADGVARPVRIAPAEMPAQRVISGARSCDRALPLATVRRGSFSLKEVSR